MRPLTGRIRVWLVSGVVLASGCSTYQITQFDNVAVPGFHPKTYKRAAIVTHRRADASGDRGPDSFDPNRLFLEAFQVELMKRGFEVVEREKFAKLVDEQLLVRGEIADLSDREKAMRLGKIMDVDVVFYADALINNSRYEYAAKFLLSTKDQARDQQRKTNETGVVEGIGKYTIYAYHDVGVTVRAIDAHTGEIIWVGYRMLASCEEVTEDTATALTSFATIKRLCGEVLKDFFSPLKYLSSSRG